MRGENESRQIVASIVERWRVRLRQVPQDHRAATHELLTAALDELPELGKRPAKLPPPAPVSTDPPAENPAPKKATRKKATRKKATRKKATRKKATRKKGEDAGGE